jgi:hypothetical protein
MNFSINLSFATYSRSTTLIDINATINNFHVIQRAEVSKKYLKVSYGKRTVHFDITALFKRVYHMNVQVTHTDDPFDVLYDVYERLVGTDLFNVYLAGTTNDMMQFTDSSIARSVEAYNAAQAA